MKTDSDGQPVHEECYFQEIKLKRMRNGYAGTPDNISAPWRVLRNRDVSPTIHKLALPKYNSCMARIWKEAFDSVKHGGLPDSLPDAVEPLRRHCTAPTLVSHDVVFISVCSFTFRFYSRQQLERVLITTSRRFCPAADSLNLCGV